MNFIRFTIVLSIVVNCSSLCAKESLVGAATSAILGARYDAFASEQDTETGNKASCVSSVIYGLRAAGYECSYRDFRVYQRAFRKQAKELVLGRTTVDDRGIVIFSASHFANFYEDSNLNGVVDVEDKIIHAYFHPVEITTIGEWLARDPIRPILYVDVGRGLDCP